MSKLACDTLMICKLDMSVTQWFRILNVGNFKIRRKVHENISKSTKIEQNTRKYHKITKISRNHEHITKSRKYHKIPKMPQNHENITKSRKFPIVLIALTEFRAHYPSLVDIKTIYLFNQNITVPNRRTIASLCTYKQHNWYLNMKNHQQKRKCMNKVRKLIKKVKLYKVG